MKLQKLNEVTEVTKLKNQTFSFQFSIFNYQLFILLFFLAGCAAGGGFSFGDLATTTTVSATTEQILRHQPEFTTMNASRISLSIRFGQQNHNVRGSLRMYRDSVIQLSIQPLPGVELFRAQLTPDSIVVLDRLKSEFVRGDYNFIHSRFGINADFFTLQNLFSNHLFLAGRKYMYSSDYNYFRLNSFPDGYMLEAKNEDFVYDHEFIANRSFRITQSTLTHRREPYFLKFDYADFASNDNVIFPSKMNVTLFNGQLSNFLNITINSVEFNKQTNVSFSIPRRYTEIIL